MTDDKRPLPTNEFQRGVSVLIAIISLAIGWILGILSAPRGDTNRQAALMTVSQYTEPLQDPRERELIRKLEIGDDLSIQNDLRMLVDEVIRPSDESFEMIYNFYSKEHPGLPVDCSECEILYFNLRSQEFEGVRDYYIVTRNCEVLAICEGESVTI